MKRVVAWADAHAVMPRHGKGPPHQSSQNGLPDGERDDVAFAREEPAHGDAANES